MAKADKETGVEARGKLLGQANATLLADLPAAPLFFPYVRRLVKGYVLNWVDNPRSVNRTRWLDLQEKTAGVAPIETAGGDQGFWGWLGSWFSADAWSKWWNS